MSYLLNYVQIRFGQKITFNSREQIDLDLRGMFVGVQQRRDCYGSGITKWKEEGRSREKIRRKRRMKKRVRGDIGDDEAGR